ncbi:MAG: hypothetical protein KKD28_10435, partial [Chloroflexi bacterium]|nr:hypothetical protein [Chloroflexota bacterium]
PKRWLSRSNAFFDRIETRFGRFPGGSWFRYGKERLLNQRTALFHSKLCGIAFKGILFDEQTK